MKKEETNKIVSSDDDMPKQRTKDYNAEAKVAQQTDQPDLTHQFMKLKPKFLEKLNETIGTMPFNTILGDAQHYVRLSQLMEFVEANKNKISVAELNSVIQFIAYAPFNNVHMLMIDLMNPARQPEYWDPVA